MNNRRGRSNLFEQVWVISLKRRPDRLERFWTGLTAIKWPFRVPKVFHAIDGDKVGVPKYWQTGGGSYGCLRSHMSILERAIIDDVESILILEDDATFLKSFAADVTEFLTKVPDDWQCLMLGGQHVNSKPNRVSNGIVRAGGGGGIQRTHCYALRGAEAMKALYGTWADAAVHCDWVMGPCMARFNTYAPDPFLVGQAEGKSDISGSVNQAKFWRPPAGYEPVIILRSSRQVMEVLRTKGWHGGYSRDPKTGIDLGLRDLLRDKSLTEVERRKKFGDWINVIQNEVLSMNEPSICTVWHPTIDADFVKSAVKGKVVEIKAASPEEALRKLPGDIRSRRDPTINVVLLRSSRETMENLRGHGWHSGYWRDEITGEDNGIRNLLLSNVKKAERNQNLRQIARLMNDQVQSIPNGIVTFWNEKLTADMIKCEDINVIEITAKNPTSALEKLKRAIG